MEIQISSLPTLFAFSLFVFMLIKILMNRAKTTNMASKLPPGPWKLPLLGNMLQLVGSLPHHALRDLAKKHGPLMYLQIGQIPTIVVSSPEFAKEVMKTHDLTFSNRPRTIISDVLLYDSTDLIFSPYGEYWRQLRKICNQELLSTSRVQSFKPIREEEMFSFMQWIASNVGSVINLSKRIHSSTYSITSRSAFGKECKDQEKFVELIVEGSKFSGGFEIADLFPSFSVVLSRISGRTTKFKKWKQRAEKIMEVIINDHKDKKWKNKDSNEGEIKEEDVDLVDVLLKYHNNDSDQEFSLTIDNIKAVILDIFSAGSETSSTAVDWAMAETIKNPRVMEKAQDEVRRVFSTKGSVDESAISDMKYLKAIVKETLRLHPPAALSLPRECSTKCEINGYEIPAKTRVIVNAWAIGRDPRYWAEPESFMPERFLDSSIDYKGTNFEYIPFGAGRRICPGVLYGIINVELPLAMLLYHFDWKLPNGMRPQDLDMTELFGITVGRKQDLNVIPIPYDLTPIDNFIGKMKC